MQLQKSILSNGFFFVSFGLLNVHSQGSRFSDKLQYPVSVSFPSSSTFPMSTMFTFLFPSPSRPSPTDCERSFQKIKIVSSVFFFPLSFRSLPSSYPFVLIRRDGCWLPSSEERQLHVENLISMITPSLVSSLSSLSSLSLSLLRAPLRPLTAPFSLSLSLSLSFFFQSFDF